MKNHDSVLPGPTGIVVLYDEGGVIVTDHYYSGKRDDLWREGKVDYGISPFTLEPQTVVRTTRGLPPDVFIG